MLSSLVDIIVGCAAIIKNLGRGDISFIYTHTLNSFIVSSTSLVTPLVGRLIYKYVYSATYS